MKLTKSEQETIINFNEAECTASVYTHNKAEGAAFGTVPNPPGAGAPDRRQPLGRAYL